MKKIFFTLFALLIALPALLHAQVAWTEPAFPTDYEPVTVYFDATEGTGGLADCNCDVYVHTGVITSNSTSGSDWKYVYTTWGQADADWKMEPVAGQSNMYSYEISPTIREKYNVTNPDEIIEQLAFVFRNSDGSKEGKAEGGTDIFLDVYPEDDGLVVEFVKPDVSSLFTSLGALIQVEANANQTATLSLFDNGNLLNTTTGTSLAYNILVSEGGTHLVELQADNGVETVTTSFVYVIPADTQVEALPAGVEPGINYLSDTEVLFALVAPNKENIFLIGDFNNWDLNTDYQLKNTPDGEVWWIQIDGLTPGQTYGFQYVVDGSIRIGDPYSDLILDPGNDPWIPEEVFPDMHPYPDGKTTGIVSLMQPGAPGYPWEVTDFQRPDQTKLVVYELLLRDFLNQDYAGLESLLDYFEELGVNAIELMPVNEFDGNNSWGYNPTYHYALDKYYGTPDALRSFIDECHKRGIAVILDVVFNHAHEKNPLCMLYWNDQLFRPAADNIWLNEEPTHDFNVFFDFNHESTYTRDYVKKNLRHWLVDYKFDGFRFDLSKGFTQNTNGPFDAGAYDATRIGIIKEYADAMQAASPGSYVILEHFTANTEEKELSDYGAMFWGGAGIHNQYLEASMGYPSSFNSASYINKGFDDPHLIVYMESHDEERMMYKNLEFGNSNGNYNVKDYSTALDRTELANVFFYTIPGPKMLWQFGEVGYDFSINYCENGTINPDCRTAPKPIRWDYNDDPERVDVYNVIRSLLHLRNNYDVMHTGDFDLNVASFAKAIHLNSTDLNVTVLGNFDVVERTIDPAFQSTGTWYEYFTGETLQVMDPNASITLQPGEYRLYTDGTVTKPQFVTNDTEVQPTGMSWTITPNPAQETSRLFVNLTEGTKLEVLIFDLQGRLIEQVESDTYVPGEYQLPLPALRPGMYMVQLKAGSFTDTQKLMVTE